MCGVAECHEENGILERQLVGQCWYDQVGCESTRQRGYMFLAYLGPFVCREVNFFGKVNSGKSEFRESIFQCLVVLWKINWKTLSSVWLCYGK
jgi:hypothetical protein